MVERGRGLSNLSTQFHGQRRRRHRRSAGNRFPPGLRQESGRRRDLAESDLRFAERRQRVRHTRLPPDHRRFRHDGRFRHPTRRSPFPGHETRARPGRQPYERRTSVVRRSPQIAPESLLRLLPLVADRERRASATQKLFRRGRERMEVQFRDDVLLPALFLPQTARPEMGESPGSA